jgi:ribosomal protein S21
MIKVVQEEKEKSENVIRKFVRAVQQSKILPKIRGQRFHKKKPNKNKIKKNALYRVAVGQQADKLKRMGLFNEDKLRDIKKNIKI